MTGRFWHLSRRYATDNQWKEQNLIILLTLTSRHMCVCLRILYAKVVYVKLLGMHIETELLPRKATG